MAIEPDFQWTINPINLLWSIGGALIAGATLIWRWGSKWQTIESLATKMQGMEDRLDRQWDALRADIKAAEESCNLSVARIHAELEMLKDEKAKYRIEIARLYPTRDEFAKLADLVGSIRERVPHPHREPGE